MMKEDEKAEVISTHNNYIEAYCEIRKLEMLEKLKIQTI